VEPVLRWLAANPYVLLFVVVAGAVLIGRIRVKGYNLGMVASAIVLGAAISAWASTYGIKMEFDNFAKSLFFFLFMYGIGLRTGPSFVNGLRRGGLRFVALAVIASTLGVAGAVGFAYFWDLPTGAAGGILAGALTISAALGSAEQAVREGAVTLGPNETMEQVSGMIAICYGLTYLWGTVGIILICKYLPRWWGLDARAAAQQYELEFGVPNVDDSGLTAFRPVAVRAHRLEVASLAGRTVQEFRQAHPQLKLLDIAREGERCGAPDGFRLQLSDVLVLGGRLDAVMGLAGTIGPEVADEDALTLPIDVAEILVLSKAVEGKPLREFRDADYAGQVALRRVERGGVPIPIGLETNLQRLDVLFVGGLTSAVERMARDLGRVVRPGTATDLLAWALGMVIGFLIGMISVPIAGLDVELGAGGGLLVSGILMSAFASRVRVFGVTPNAARNIIEDLGLVLFIAMVGVNAGASLLAQLNPELTAKILVAGFVCTTIPPIVVWAVGYHWMRLNPAVLMGAVAGARTHSGPALEASREIGSSVPWIGFPIAYAISEVLLTIAGYVSVALN
jgi:putative transport protein